MWVFATTIKWLEGSLSLKAINKPTQSRFNLTHGSLGSPWSPWLFAFVESARSLYPRILITWYQNDMTKCKEIRNLKQDIMVISMTATDNRSR